MIQSSSGKRKLFISFTLSAANKFAEYKYLSFIRNLDATNWNHIIHTPKHDGIDDMSLIYFSANVPRTLFSLYNHIRRFIADCCQFESSKHLFNCYAGVVMFWFARCAHDLIHTIDYFSSVVHQIKEHHKLLSIGLKRQADISIDMDKWMLIMKYDNVVSDFTDFFKKYKNPESAQEDMIAHLVLCYWERSFDHQEDAVPEIARQVAQPRKLSISEPIHLKYLAADLIIKLSNWFVLSSKLRNFLKNVYKNEDNIEVTNHE
jgi:hypothetical protein